MRDAAFSSLSRRALVIVLAVIALGSVAIPAAGRLFEPAAPDSVGDPVTVFGPQTFYALGGTQTYVETFSAATAPGSRFVLEIVNGAAGGADRVSSATVTLNGAAVVEGVEVGTGVALHSVEVELLDSNTLEVSVTGSDSAFMSVAIWRESDPTFIVWGPDSVLRNESLTDTLPALTGQTAPPYYLHLVNGARDGSGRVTSGRVVLNGVEVVSPSALSQSVGGFVLEIPLLSASPNTIHAEASGNPGSSFELWISSSDSIAPVISNLEPADSALSDTTQILVAGEVQDQTSVVVLVGQDTAQLLAGAFTHPTPLSVEGSNEIQVTAVDAAGNTTSSARTVIRDTEPPVMVVGAPADGLVTNQTTVAVSGSVEDLTSAAVTANGVAVSVDGFVSYTGALQAGTFSGSAALDVEGVNFLTVVATDAVGRTASITREVTRDSEAPGLTVTEPVDGAEVQADTIIVAGAVVDSTAVSVVVNGQAVLVDSTGAFSASVPLEVGSNAILVEATDAAGNVTIVTLTVTGVSTELPLPPDPVTTAPSLDPTVPTTTASSVAFLWQGPDPVQIGVEPNAIAYERTAVIRGYVQQRDSLAIPGVRVSVVGHPELGYTLTREDGAYDLVVNGGGQVTLDFTKDGLLPVHRHLTPGWQEFINPDPVVLLPLDTVATVVDLSTLTTVQPARGSTVADADGSRTATALFKPGTSAVLIMPDGSEQSVDRLTVRATEYTVGATGPLAMPAPLPRNVGYTYAVELSADEALAAGASHVRFSRSVPVYVENFLSFAVGGAVPCGTYDRDLGGWLACSDGRVIAVLDTVGGVAAVDVDGSGLPADSTALAELGFDVGELESLAELYAPGQELWRISVDHFSAYDKNWPLVARSDSEWPKGNSLEDEGCKDRCTETGSVIWTETQSLGQVVGLAGTPFALHYTSDRTTGRKDNYQLDISLTDDSLPPELRGVRLEIEVAGRGPWKFVEAPSGGGGGAGDGSGEISHKRFLRVPDLGWDFSPDTNLSHVFTWDGRDAYGRTVQGGQKARVRVGYRYPASYAKPAEGDIPAFAAGGDGTSASASRETWEVTLWTDNHAWVGPYDSRAVGLGGWTLNVHHTYDAETQTLYRGDGSQRSAGTLNRMISTIAGKYLGNGTSSGDGGPARLARFFWARGLAVGPDGSVYVGEQSRVRRIRPDGMVEHVADFRSPQYLTVGPDGSVYVAEFGYNQIRRVHPDGSVVLVAGTGIRGFSGDGGPAVNANLGTPRGLTVDQDGNLYFVESDSDRVRRVSPDGIIETVVGGGPVLGEGPARGIRLYAPTDVKVGPRGDLYILDYHQVKKVDQEGMVSIVGFKSYGFPCGDGGSALNACGREPHSMTFGPDGTLYVNDLYYPIVRAISTDGIINTVAGDGVASPKGTAVGDGGPARAARFYKPLRVAAAPDGSVYVIDHDETIRRIGTPLPGVTGSDVAVASEDGTRLFVFDESGRHLETRNALTGTLVHEFAYDSLGHLASITDADSLVTTVERDAGGVATAIVGPYGQRTELAVDTEGWLATVVGPAGDTTSLDHAPDGLLQSLVDPRGGSHVFAYDSLGRLATDTDPAGAVKSLARTELEDGHQVSSTTAGGRVTTYAIEGTSTNGTLRTVTGPDGLSTTSVQTTAEATTLTRPDGTVLTTRMTGDPRFGMLSPVLGSMTTTTPSGLTVNVTGRRTATLADVSDPSSLLTQLDSTTVNGRVYTRLYDAATRRFTSTTPTGRQSVSVIDAKGRVVKDSITGVAATAYAYDAQGRPDSVSQAGHTWRFAYDAAGRLLSTTDPLGRSDSLFYDAAGRVTRQVLRDSGEIAYGYDAAGNLTSLAPPGRPAHTFVYNALGLDSIYDPPDVPGLAEDRTFYSYNVDRDLTRILRPDGLAIDFAYDAAGRVDSIASPEGILDYQYSPTTGQLTGIAAPGGEGLSFAYDGSLPTRETWTGTVSGQVGFAYDTDFRLSGLAVNGDTVAYGYDQDGLLTTAGAMVLNRDPLNGVLTSTALGAVTTRRGYDQRGLLSGDSAWVGGVLTFARTYQRDELGRITAVEDLADGVTTLWEYGYDAAGRLETVTRDGVAYASYTYDANGNRLTRTSGAGVETGVYDAQDRMTSYAGATYTYSANGELETKVEGADTTRYDYDVFGNLTRVDLPDGTVIEYVIDGRNRRVGKKVDGVLVQGFLYGDQLNPVAELDGAGNVVSRFIYAAKSNVPDYMVRGGDTLRMMSDHLGSVRMVVEVASGAVVQRLSYDAWGRVLEDTNPAWQPFGFAGGVWEAGTGLVRFGARDYGSRAAVWTNIDPLGFRVLSTNMRSYAPDPINSADYTGLYPLCSYGIGSGILLCIDTEDPTWALGAQGHSGSDEPFLPGLDESTGSDNVLYQGEPSYGPLPQGYYRIGVPKYYHDMYNWMDLYPSSGNMIHWRFGLAIHGSEKGNPRGGSAGCMLLPAAARERLGDRVEKYGYGILYVYP